MNNIYLIAPVYELFDKVHSRRIVKRGRLITCHCIINDKKFQKHIIYPGICIIICLYFQYQTFKTYEIYLLNNILDNHVVLHSTQALLFQLYNSLFKHTKLSVESR